MRDQEIPGGLEPDETTWDEVEVLELDTTGLIHPGAAVGGDDELALLEEPDDWDAPLSLEPEGGVDEEDLDVIDDDPDAEDDAELVLLQELGIDLDASDSVPVGADLGIDLDPDEPTDDEVAA